MRALTAFAALAGIAASVPAAATTLTVGPGKTFATPCAAVAAANPNDEIDISVGTYTDTCSINKAGLTLKGVGGQPKIDLSAGTPSGQKGIYVIDAAGVTIENLELTGAHIDSGSGENGAGIRIEAANLTVRGCFIHDNQDGILGSPLTAGGTLLIESTEFSHNGMGNGCDDGNGCTHNLYIGANFQTFTFQYNWSHDLATDTPDKGHLLKSRAQQTFVLYNRITGETDTDSYEIDVPQGGLAVIVGNMVQKPSTSGNGSMLSYAEEGAINTDKRIFVANNTFVSDHAGGNFLNITNGGVLTAHNNIFVGTGTASSTGPLSADNSSETAPLFVDQAGYDYHLMAGAPAIGKGVPLGNADTFSLKPVHQYAQPLGQAARTDQGVTLGAFQYGAAMAGTGGTTAGTGGTTGTGGSADTGGSVGAGGNAGAGGSVGIGGGTPTKMGSGGAAATGASGSSTNDAGADSPRPKSAMDSGCGCRLVGSGPMGAPVALALGIAFVWRQRRRKCRVRN